MYHQISLVGNLGRDPEMRYTQSGTPVTTLSVATNRTYTSNGETVKETVWFRVSVWGKQAETCNEYLKKGRSVLVVGRLNPDKETGGPRIWQDKDGNSRASFEITADNVRFLGGGGGEHAASGEDAAVPSAGSDEDIPF